MEIYVDYIQACILKRLLQGQEINAAERRELIPIENQLDDDGEEEYMV